MAKYLHPDKNKADDAEERFNELKQIYETLKDKEKREVYNQILRAYEENKKRYASQREERQAFMDDLASRTTQFEEKTQKKAKEEYETQKGGKESALNKLIRETKEAEYEEEQKKKEKDFKQYFEETRVIRVSWKEGKSSLFSEDLIRQIFSSYGLLLSVDYQKNQALLTFDSARGAQTAIQKAKEELTHTGLKVNIHKGGDTKPKQKQADEEEVSEEQFISALKLEMALSKEFERKTGTWEEYLELEERILKKL